MVSLTLSICTLNLSGRDLFFYVINSKVTIGEGDYSIAYFPKSLPLNSIYGQFYVNHA